MKEKEAIGKRIGKALANRIGTIALVLVIVLIGVSIAGYVWDLEWTGLRRTTNDGPKTLWHWLDLLIIPIVLAAGALWFKRVEVGIARTVEIDRAQETALDTYFDRMSELLLDKDNPLIASESGSPCQEMATTRTLAVLRRLDEKRRNQVFQFLRDARLLGRTEVLDINKTVTRENDPIAVFQDRNMSDMVLEGANLGGANLDGSDLKGTNLKGANLEGANLKGANLFGADLERANLIEANLETAGLQLANLKGANLFEANLESAQLKLTILTRAILCKANLESAIMWGADLEAADLLGANLEGANLYGVNLKGAQLGETLSLTCEQLLVAENWIQAYRDKDLYCGEEMLPIRYTFTRIMKKIKKITSWYRG